jgi:hypothetical protein
MAKFDMTLSEVSALFKIKYEKLSENVYNSANVLLGRVKKSYNFTGKELAIAVPQSFAGGVGSGSLPTANTAIYGDARIQAKKMYAVVEIDRETIKASLSDEGAFVRATKEVVQKGVESFMRNLSRCLFSDGSGELGEVASIAGNVVTITAASFKEANLEERDLVNALDVSTSSIIGGSNPELVEITAVDPSTREVTLSAIPTGLAAGDKLIMQGSHNADPEGLKLLDKSTGSSYGIAHGRRWKAAQKLNANTGISTDLLNEMMLAVKKQSGKSPNLIITSFKQYEKILNLIDGQTQYNVETRAGLKGKNGVPLSFSGIQFMSVDGPVGIFPERFCDDDRVYFLNDSHIHIHHRPDFGWFDDDGTVFLRKALSDAYEARYGGYLQVYINPCFHGVITGLT